MNMKKIISMAKNHFLTVAALVAAVFLFGACEEIVSGGETAPEKTVAAPPPAHGISLDKTETFTFTRDYVGYEAYGGISPTPVVVTNTGTEPTGQLAAALSGTNADSFTITGGSIENIEPEETEAFSIKPKAGLAVGTYTAGVTVTGTENTDIGAAFNVSFTVEPPKEYAVTLDKTGIYSFNGGLEGSELSGFTVTVRNRGTKATGNLIALLRGDHESSFVDSARFISSIAPEGTGTFNVVPKQGLRAGTYVVTLTVEGNEAIPGTGWTTHGINESFVLHFVVSSPTYGIRLDKSSHIFDWVEEGYEPIEPLTVTVTNIGNMPTGPLTIGLSPTDDYDPDDHEAFQLSGVSLSNIDVGGEATFTVGPRTGFPVDDQGGYRATVTVSGGNGIKARLLRLRFDVEDVRIYDVTLSQKEDYVFGPVDAGYGAITPLGVTVTNTGTMPIITVTPQLTGAGTGNFTLVKTTWSEYQWSVGTNGGFTVAPVTGLPAGTYGTTVMVSGNNSVNKSFGVSFTVNAPVLDYNIGLSETGTHTFAEAAPDYQAISPLAVTVTNTGLQPTGTLTAALSGAHADSFAMVGGTLSSIGTGETGSFTVGPNTGLASGVYTATVTVSGGNGISAAFTVTMTVKPSAAMIAPDEQSIAAKFGVNVTENTPQKVTQIFAQLKAYLETQTAATLAASGDIALGDWIDLPHLTVAGYPTDSYDTMYGKIDTDNTELSGHGYLLRLIVVGINSYNGLESGENSAHLVFQFQNLPATHRMYPSINDRGGYLGSEMREYLIPTGKQGSGNFLAGLIAAGVPENVMWAPSRKVWRGFLPSETDNTVKSSISTGAESIVTVEDKLFLPTAWEMLNNGGYSLNGEGNNAGSGNPPRNRQAHFAYYGSGQFESARIKYDTGNASLPYFLASPVGQSYNGAPTLHCAVDSSGGGRLARDMTHGIGVAPVFCVK
jgi:hypothetical protein